jgi:hypothetical protein
MNDPVRDEGALLDDVRRVLSPTRSDRDRLQARIAASIALGAPGPALDGAPVAQAPSGAPTALAGIRGLGSQALAGALLATTAFGAGYFTGRSSRTSEPAAVVAPSRAKDVRPSPPAAPATPAAPRAEPEPPRRAAKAPSVPANTPASSPEAHSVSEEARELQRVDRALRSGMPGLALGILRELDERFPRGVLLEERAAARLMARCQNGDPEAPGAAAAWLERHEQSVYAARLRAACAEK